MKLLRAEGDLVVGDNEPYAVSDLTDYTIPVHGEARGLINTGIEIRQDLIADRGRPAAMGGAAGADFPRDRSDAARAAADLTQLYLVRVSASQMPPPIMKPPEMRDTSRVRRAEKNLRARPASSA